MTTTPFNVRLDDDLRREAEATFEAFGMTMSEAIRIFLHKSVMVGGLPFDVRQPVYNATTRAALAESRRIASGEVDAPRYSDTKAMMAAILAEDDPL
ncbi:MAG: type II toxin-antitoxin system RelB/DinJ family antitoxin [Bifidobacteriaceae bacterium]|jgi:DNA-damage-inducible protein J|nr:type II toxin-antitoxin system RelB/DinJ family antitoxin [Bifidobacteriaceae bacterium]